MRDSPPATRTCLPLPCSTTHAPLSTPPLLSLPCSTTHAPLSPPLPPSRRCPRRMPAAAHRPARAAAMCAPRLYIVGDLLIAFADRPARAPPLLGHPSSATPPRPTAAAGAYYDTEPEKLRDRCLDKLWGHCLKQHDRCLDELGPRPRPLTAIPRHGPALACTALCTRAILYIYIYIAVTRAHNPLCPAICGLLLARRSASATGAMTCHTSSHDHNQRLGCSL